jgi:hypothetical protein
MNNKRKNEKKKEMLKKDRSSDLCFRPQLLKRQGSEDSLGKKNQQDFHLNQ